MGRGRLLVSDAPGDGGLGVAPDLLRHDPVLEVVLGDGELGGAVLRAPVQVEVAVRRAPEPAELALERLQLLVHRAPVVLQLGRDEEHFATNITRQGLVLHVDHLDVDLQIIFVVESFATVWAYKHYTTVMLLVVEV